MGILCFSMIHCIDSLFHAFVPGWLRSVVGAAHWMRVVSLGDQVLFASVALPWLLATSDCRRRELALWIHRVSNGFWQPGLSLQ